MSRRASLIGMLGILVIGAGYSRTALPDGAVDHESAIDSIPSPAAPGSGEPYLATGPSGRIYMSWLEPADSSHALRFAFLEGNRWSSPSTVRTGRDFFVNWADFPSIHVVDRERIAVHWLQRNGRGTYAYGVRVAQSNDGGKTWGTAVMPHRDSSQNEHGFVAMWPESGKLGVVWLDGRKFSREGHDAANEMMLLTTTIDAKGSLGPEVRLDERTCDCCQNSAAMTSSGPIIAYRNRSPDEIRDIYVTRRVGNSWTDGVAVHADNWKIPACPVNGPDIDANGNRVAVAWFSAADDKPRVKLAFSENGGAAWRAPIQIDDGNPAGRVDVELLTDGSALVTWIERTGGEVAVVRARRVSAAGRAGTPVTIATSSAARASGFPRMAISGSDVVFAWTQPGRPSNIRLARAKLADFR